MIVNCASRWRAHGQSPSGARRLGVNCWLRRLVSRLVSEAQRGPSALPVMVTVIPRMWLKKIEVIAYITKSASFFSGSPLLRTKQLSALDEEQSWDGWPPGKFLRQCVTDDESC